MRPTDVQALGQHNDPATASCGLMDHRDGALEIGVDGAAFDEHLSGSESQ
jgi:hypothetical protein